MIDNFIKLIKLIFFILLLFKLPIILFEKSTYISAISSRKKLYI